MNKIISLVLMFAGLVGCHYKFSTWQSVTVKASQQDQHLVELIYRHLHARELEQAASLSVDGMDLKYWQRLESRFIGWFPEAPIAKMEVVNAMAVALDGRHSQHNISLQVRHQKKFVLFEAVLSGPENDRKLSGFQISPLAKRMDVNNSTAWEDVTGLHIAMMLLMIIIPVFILFTFYHCWRHTDGINKYYWLVFIVVGVAQFRVHWGSGDFGLWWQSLSFLGVTFQLPGHYEPMKLGVSLPLGAIMYWMFKDQVKNSKQAQSGAI